MPQFDMNTWLETLIYALALLYLWVMPTITKTVLSPNPHLQSAYTFERTFWLWP